MRTTTAARFGARQHPNMEPKTNRCRALILRGGFSLSGRCRNPAVTEAGYCRLHDPEAVALRAAARAAARGPSKYHRWVNACNALDSAVGQLPKEHYETIRRLLSEERLLR